VPQTHADSADAPELTIDPLNQGTSSAVILKQATITPPQGKVLIIKLLPMNFSHKHHHHP